MRDPNMALLHRLFAFWQEVLQMRDVRVSVRIADALSTPDSVMETSVASAGEDTGHLIVDVAKGIFAQDPQYISDTVCHELLHGALTPVTEILTGMDGQFTEAQRSLLSALLLKGNEAVTYKLERVLTALVPVPKEVFTPPTMTKAKTTKPPTKKERQPIGFTVPK